MPHKKGKKKTIPKHKKKGVKHIAKHKIPLTLNSKPTSLLPFPFSLLGFSPKVKREQKNFRDEAQKQKENKKGRRIGVTPVAVEIPFGACNPVQTVCTDTVSNQPAYKKKKDITNTPKKGKVAQESLMQMTNNKKRRLPVEVMPSGNDDGNVRVIDNLPELKTVNTSTVNTGNTSIGVANLTQAKKIREQVWIHHNGKMFECKCYVTWCTNKVDVFNFQVGHDTPKALGGSNELLNLKPICQNCNQSMGSRYSITEWNQLFTAQRRQMSTMIDRRNSEMATSLLTPIEYEKIDLSSNIFVKQQPSNILADQEVPISPTIQQTEKMQPGNAQLETMPSRNMCYGPLARLMPMRANRSVIIQSAVSVMVLVGAWFFGA